jgi:hypothetical protein
MRPKLIIVGLCASAIALVGAIVGVARSKPSAPVVDASKGFAVAAPVSERIKLRQEVSKAESRPSAIPTFHWSEVESADYKEYIAKLRAVQCPEETIRDIIIADINKLYAPREAPFKVVIEAPEDGGGDWHADRPRRQANFERRKQLHAIQREKNALLKELLGIELPLEPLRGRDSRSYELFEAAFNALPAHKRDAVRAIQENYWQMSDALKDKYDHKRTPEYLEEYRRINEDRKGKLTAVLTPEELEDYDMRHSNVARNLQSSLQGFSPTEEEFKTIYRLRKEIEEPHGGLLGIVTPVDAQGNPIPVAQESSAERRQRLNEQVKEALGPDRAREYELSQDSTYRTLGSLGQRYGLSSDAVMQSYELQQTYRTQQRELANNRSLSNEERNAALKQVRENHFKQFSELIGERAARAYQRSRGEYYGNE